MQRQAAIALVLVLAAAVAAVSGCDLGDVVRVKTPAGVQQDAGLPSSLTLNEAEREYQLELQRVKSDLLAWREAIEHANVVRSVLNQLAMQQLTDLGPTLGGVPILGPALVAGLPLAALFVRRPGDKSKADVLQVQRSEHDKGWDEGRAELLRELAQVGVRLPADKAGS